jgi:transcriptional regulator with XRE-family HTH domain
MRKRYTAVRYRLVDALGQRSQAEIAKELGISQSSLSRLLSPGGMRLTVDFLLRFAEKVGADPAYLLTGHPTPNEVKLPSPHNQATVPTSPQHMRNEGDYLAKWEGGLLQSLTGHFSAIRAVYSIAEAVRDFPEHERAIASAVERAVAGAIQQSRAGRPNG